MKVDNSLPGKSGKVRMTNFGVGVASLILVCASAQVVAQGVARGASPTPNQHIAYCRAEYDVIIRSGQGSTGVVNTVIFPLARASTEELRSGAWLNEYRRLRTRDTSHNAIAECMVRGELAGRNGTFRTPSMIVDTRIDDDARGRQDPIGNESRTVGAPTGDNSADRLAREQAHTENVRRYEEDVRRNQAARAEAQRLRDAEDARKIQEQRSGRAKERAALEAKIRGAIFQPGGVIHYVDNKKCWVTYTNRTPYWVTVVSFYTITWQKPGFSAASTGNEDAMELPPGQSQSFPVWAVHCEQDEWNITGGSITLKDNVNNYPSHLR